jgi:SAM-dependent MidA family methyltransferase
VSPEGFGKRQLSFAERLARLIALGGPISLSHYIGEANAHYYSTRDPLGAAGDFTTSPEISQMFGEFIGLFLADIWHRSGRREQPYYVELGPGRGTLAADALRAMQPARMAPQVHFVETSMVLRGAQASAVPHAHFHDDVESLPTDCPLMIVANEFFDALPITQAVKTVDGWREQMVRLDESGRFELIVGDRSLDATIPPAFRDAPIGSIYESCPAGVAIMLALANRVSRQGGAMVVIDYGYEGPAIGDTFQAMRAHGYSNPMEHVGESDLTAHVDFSMLANAARQAGLNVLGPTGQGAFLTRLGITARAQALAQSSPDRAEEVMIAQRRLVSDDQMGRLFKVVAATHPAWPAPEGF